MIRRRWSQQSLHRTEAHNAPDSILPRFWKMLPFYPDFNCQTWNCNVKEEDMTDSRGHIDDHDRIVAEQGEGDEESGVQH